MEFLSKCVHFGKTSKLDSSQKISGKFGKISSGPIRINEMFGAMKRMGS